MRCDMPCSRVRACIYNFTVQRKNTGNTDFVCHNTDVDKYAAEDIRMDEYSVGQRTYKYAACKAWTCSD